MAARVLAVFREFDRLAARSLWPGFDPQRIPVALFDGTDTYLLRHPRPPQDFTAVRAAMRRLPVFGGRHEAMRANTGAPVNDIPTAMVDISSAAGRSTTALAALLIHETFHVYAKDAHPDWVAEETELVTYPLDDAEVLLRRRPSCDHRSGRAFAPAGQAAVATVAPHVSQWR